MTRLTQEQNNNAEQQTEPVQKNRKNLVSVVSQKLRETISSGALAPGDKLPSENEMTQKYGVSRTVIREAIAALRSDNLVEARHGVGVFVLALQSTSVNGLRNTEPSRISSIIEMLELRTAVEAEAAALAALRRSPAQDEAILEAYHDLHRAIAQKEATANLDFCFHLAIADATNNPRFREFIELVGRQLIPRDALRDDDTEQTSDDYLAQIQNEHLQIADAISKQDEKAAREAMRMHLKGSQQRYRDLMRRS